MVEVLDSPSIFFNGMAGTQTPIAIAHGEGFADFSQTGDIRSGGAALRYVDNRGAATEAYPFNPNGSPQRPDVGDDAGRPLHGDDAARRARVPHGTAIVAPGIMG
jgi:hypothetical protein